jgi:hypothetical protein
MKPPALILFLCLLPAAGLAALDLWRHPQAAEKNAIFADAGLSFPDGFTASPARLFRLDYLLPLLLPLSAGAYLQAPDPNLTSFGARLGWHIDIRDPAADLYFLYVFDLGFLRNDLLEEYGDEKQELRRYDFRAGLRYRFGRYIFLSLETSFKLFGFSAGLSLKIN